MTPETFVQHVRTWVGVELTPEQQARFRRFMNLLLDWNRRMNLTAHRTPEQILVYHFLDSLSLLRVLGPLSDLHLADVGTGAGFPGLPLKIACPDIHLTLFESSSKTARFLEAALRTLEFPDVELVVERVEQAAHKPAYREAFDLVVARGVAAMPTLVEYLLPLTKIGGQAVAYKGPRAAEEVWAARQAIEELGGTFERIEPVDVPELPARRTLVFVRKVRPTPAKYPRKPGIPAKRPLGTR